MAKLVISYSREDRMLVRALVLLLRTSLKGLDRAVFWDEDFEPGEPWFEQIKTHIVGAPQLFVFWCHHSAGSSAVRREYMFAVTQGTRVVPVLIDETPLSNELAPIHGIDLRGALNHQTGSDGPHLGAVLEATFEQGTVTLEQKARGEEADRVADVGSLKFGTGAESISLAKDLVMVGLHFSGMAPRKRIVESFATELNLPQVEPP